MTRKVLFMVRRPYFNAIKNGTKTIEIRRLTPRWRTVASHDPKEAVFLCGRDIHRRQIYSNHVFDQKEGAHQVLNRPLSKQGRKDVGSGPVVVFYLGSAIE